MLRGPKAASLAVPLVAVVLGVLAAAGCGGSAPKGPPDLVFVSTRDGDYAIFGADADGRHVRRLTKEKGDPSTPEGLFFQVDPAWSPDGQRIAFSSRRDGTDHVYVMNADGTGTRELTSGAKADLHPSWSADGTRIVFEREGALFVVPARGGKPTRVGRGFGSAAGAAWSPDGRLIAYDYRRPGGPVREIWVMKSDGTGLHQLTKLQSRSALPVWSPDGKTIAFESDAYAGHEDVYTVPASGGEPKRVTSGGQDFIQPAWTPDGRLSFSVDGAIVVLAGGEQQQLTSGKDNDSSPAWRPVQPT